MEKITEAYLRILPLGQYLRLIRDDNGDLMRHLFYDNVRDFQGNNAVNSEIASTLKDPRESDKFAVLNKRGYDRKLKL